MKSALARRLLLVLCSALALVAVLGLGTCGTQQETDSIRIGTMPTEDILPMWVAEQEGLFEKAGINAEIVVFDSAQGLSAALTAGEVDIAMTDPMRAVKLCESGTDLTLEWITLGTTPEQGRFGILTSADSGITSLADLANGTKGVGLAANTVPEYVFEQLCVQQGIDPASIPVSEVASLPDRYGLVAAGQLDAAALPASMLALGEASGLVLLADDTTGENVSQSVMVVRDAYNTGEGAKTLDAVRAVWDEAANLINADSEKYRTLLIEKANLNEQVAATYPISEYPMARNADGNPIHPRSELIEPVLTWMSAKGYVTKNVSYDETDGSFTIM